MSGRSGRVGSGQVGSGRARLDWLGRIRSGWLDWSACVGSGRSGRMVGLGWVGGRVGSDVCGYVLRIKILQS